MKRTLKRELKSTWNW